MDHSNEAPSTEIIAIPPTGEAVALDAPSEDLAAAVLHMRELEQELSRVRQIVGLEITRRMDLENLRSVEHGGFRIKVAAPGTDWDEKALEEALDELVAAEAITPGAKERLFKTTRKIQIRELSKLLATLPPDAAAKLRACSEPSKRVRSVSVENHNPD